MPAHLKNMPHSHHQLWVHYGSDCQMFPQLLSAEAIWILGEVNGKKIGNHTVKKETTCEFTHRKERQQCAPGAEGKEKVETLATSCSGFTVYQWWVCQIQWWNTSQACLTASLVIEWTPSLIDISLPRAKKLLLDRVMGEKEDGLWRKT